MWDVYGTHLVSEKNWLIKVEIVFNIYQYFFLFKSCGSCVWYLSGSC